MKIKKLELKNFAQFTDFECEFDKNVTHLVGVNGSGKTTIGLTSVWACLKGIAERSKDGLVGERFRFIGKAGKSSDIKLTVYDEKTQKEVVIKNHITATGNNITCQPVQEENWLFDLLNVAFLSAKNFSNIDSKKQALLLGVDTTEHDEKIKVLKEEFTLLNRDYRNFGDIAVVEPTESVDVSALVEKKGKLESVYYHEQELVTEHNTSVSHVNQQRPQWVEKISELKEQIKKCEKWLVDNPEVALKEAVVKPDTEKLREQIQNAQQTNNAANQYQGYLEQTKLKEEKKKELAHNKTKQDEAENTRLEYIKSFNFGFKGLNVDPTGNLVLNDRPIREPYFSKGELELIVAKLCMSQNPKLTTRFIDDFELLDEANQAKIVDGLLEKGFQIITAEVGNKKTEDNTILLRECKKVEKYEEKTTLV